jgi:3D (Asp-Asp-Asp) domain-containing protein
MDKTTKRILIGGARCLVCMLIGAAITIPLVPAKERMVYLPRYYYVTESAEPTEPLNEEEYTPKSEDLGEFKLTAYCTCPKCCGRWADGITYTGTEATPGRTIAVDPEVIPLGSSVYINGHTYVAEDIGGAIKGNRIDVLFASHQEALEFGVQYSNVSIIK